MPCPTKIKKRNISYVSLKKRQKYKKNCNLSSPSAVILQKMKKQNVSYVRHFVKEKVKILCLVPTEK